MQVCVLTSLDLALHDAHDLEVATSARVHDHLDQSCRRYLYTLKVVRTTFG